eukprot:COSAG06_NODE_2228_length_7296_cov_12.770321_3_plen_191_part_00
MESFPQDRMTAVNNYFAIILDPAVFREVATSPSASPSVGPAAAGVTAAGETVVEAAAEGQGQDDLRDVSTARLEAELAARKRLRSSSGGDEQAAAAARAAFEQEAQVLADWVTSSSPAAPIDYEVEPGALPPVVEGMAPRVLLPGGREQLARADRLEKGVMVDDGACVSCAGCTATRNQATLPRRPLPLR